jgi:hypothetical protein
MDADKATYHHNSAGNFAVGTQAELVRMLINAQELTLCLTNGSAQNLMTQSLMAYRLPSAAFVCVPARPRAAAPAAPSSVQYTARGGGLGTHRQNNTSTRSPHIQRLHPASPRSPKRASSRRDLRASLDSFRFLIATNQSQNAKPAPNPNRDPA